MGNARLNIIGRGIGSRLGLQADGTKWCVNVPRVGADLMFQMHDSRRIPRMARREQGAAEIGLEVINLDNYPIDYIRAFFKTDFFANSICYMLALGIYQGFDTIDLWGCHIKAHVEKEMCKNHPGVEFWIGQAMGRGIDVQVHGDSVLLKCERGLYGYDYPKFEE